MVYGVYGDMQWHESCVNCGCVANWHRFEIPAGTSMVAFPEKFPCGGFEFQGCAMSCDDFVFQQAVVTVE